MTATVTGNPSMPGDVHVVLGPHYAMRRWRPRPGASHRTLMLDRCYYRGDPAHVSLGWLRADGGRDFREGEGRAPPEIEDNHGEGTIFLADYSGPQRCDGADTIRLHPEIERYEEPLEEALRRHARAIGYGTSALVTAALLGLEIDCRDPRHILARENWHALLPYADWSAEEIKSGEAWEHMRQ